MSLTNSLQMLKCPYFTLKKCAIKNVNIEKDYCSVEYLRMFFFLKVPPDQPLTSKFSLPQVSNSFIKSVSTVKIENFIVISAKYIRR